ncbi:hypothetical protein MNBD_GAMMA10-2895 [hydrothermal vent metagenome]|uniref:Uncharacterized protein n=1 Tax=hydrothermal vent metagenome TaxID=652676 RepID=A0A3B0Y0K8_9ZZZZ
MKYSLMTGMLISALLSPLNTVIAAEQGVFKNRSQQQHALKKWEANKVKAEFKNMYSGARLNSAQKLNGNPWEAKRARMRQGNKQTLQQNNTWGGCREYSYKMRDQCYARGGDAYTCERYYDARVDYCNEKFQ